MGLQNHLLEVSVSFYTTCTFLMHSSLKIKEERLKKWNTFLSYPDTVWIGYSLIQFSICGVHLPIFLWRTTLSFPSFELKGIQRGNKLSPGKPISKAKCHFLTVRLSPAYLCLLALLNQQKGLNWYVRNWIFLNFTLEYIWLPMLC